MKLYVGNLSKTITDAQLNELVTPYGVPVSAMVATEKAGGSKGFGFVEFGSDDEARAAISGLDGREIDGKAIKVNEARPRGEAATEPVKAEATATEAPVPSVPAT